MVKIRLKRHGKKNQATFRVVVADSRTGTNGKVIEYIGFINPHTKERQIDVNRAKYWLSVGAQPTRTVFNFLVDKKIIEKKKLKVTNIDKKKRAEELKKKEEEMKKKAEAKKNEKKKEPATISTDKVEKVEAKK